jgi:glycosyltransferase involved in cell wall biosynthesis
MEQDVVVSVVIPTRNRPGLLLRAIKTALAQTYSNLEVVVVIDGPDHETLEALKEVNDTRLRVIALTESVGGSEARNCGVRAGKGEWIALLDDDDEWYPEKLSRQLTAASALKNRNVILSSRYLERSLDESRILPRRFPDRGEAIDAYLCRPRGLFTGGEVLQTSTLVAPRQLFLSVPFVPGLKRGQDFMWMIQAGSLGQAALQIVPEVLSIFNSEGYTDSCRVSSRPNWRSFYACVRENRALFKGSTYSYCVATRILTDAIKYGEPFFTRARLLRECISPTSPSIKCFILFLYICLVPPGKRSWLGDRLRGVTKRLDAGRSQVGAA